MPSIDPSPLMALTSEVCRNAQPLPLYLDFGFYFDFIFNINYNMLSSGNTLFIVSTSTVFCIFTNFPLQYLFTRKRYA